MALTSYVFPGVFYLRLCKKVAKLSSFNKENLHIRSPKKAIETTTNPFESGYTNDPVSPSQSPTNDPVSPSKSPSEPLLDNTDQMNVSILNKIFIFLLCFVSIVGGISSTVSVFESLVNGDAQFTLPCFINRTSGPY